MSKKTRVLVVDDDPVLLAMESDLLENDGYEVWQASTGEEAISLTRVKRPDVLLLDVRLPGISGIELCQQIKRDPVLSDTLVLLVSGAATHSSDKIKGLETGADDYLLKPMNYGELQARVRNLLRLREATTALRASEEHYRRLVEMLPDGVGLFDRRGRLLTVNAQAFRMLGYDKPEELIRKSIFELVQAEDHERLKADITATRKAGFLRNVEYQLRRKDGTLLPFEFTASAQANLPGHSPKIVVLCRDITERKWAEHQASVFSQLGFRLSGASTPEQAAKIILDVAHELFAWDAGYVDLYSQTQAKIIPILTMDTIDGERREVPRSALLNEPSPMMYQVMKNGAQLLNRDGQVAAFAMELVPFGDIQQRSASLMFTPVRSAGSVQGILSVQSRRPYAYAKRDLDLLQSLADHCGNALQRLKIAEELRLAEAKFRNILENATEGIYQATLDGRFLTVNPAMAEILGYKTPEELVSRITDIPGQLYVLPERWHELNRLLEAQKSVQEFEAQCYRKDGTRIWISINGRSVRDSAGAHIYHEATCQDITERKLAQQQLTVARDELSLERKRYHDLFEFAPDAYLATDHEGKIREANEAATALLGKRSGSIIGKSLLRFVERKDQLRLGQELKLLRNGKLHRVTGLEFGIRPLARAGTIPVATTLAAERGPQGQLRGIRWLLADISERKRLEKAMLEASEREQRRLGEDVHDGLCQRLFTVAMRGNSIKQKLAEESHPQAEQLFKVLEELKSVIGEARTLAHGLSLSNVARNGLAGALRDLAFITREEHHVDCRFKCSKSVDVEDPTIATHLYRIAREAVHNALKHARPKQIILSLAARANDRYLRVVDDGIGFPKTQTRKPGMGLDSMKYRAQAIGGELLIRARAPKGTELTCIFPKRLA